ncbi:hypothetical protein [Spirosoma litoris]
MVGTFILRRYYSDPELAIVANNSRVLFLSLRYGLDIDGDIDERPDIFRQVAFEDLPERLRDDLYFGGRYTNQEGERFYQINNTPT